MSEEKIIQFKNMLHEEPSNIITTFTLEERIWFKEKIIETMMGQTKLFDDITFMGEIDVFKPLFTSEESKKFLTNINYYDEAQLLTLLPFLICLDDGSKAVHIKELLEKQIIDTSLSVSTLLIGSLSTDTKKIESIKENILYLSEMKINIKPDTLVKLINLITADDKKIELLEETLKTDASKLEFYLSQIEYGSLNSAPWSNEFKTRIISEIPLEKIPQNLKINMLKTYCEYLSETQIQEIIKEIPLEQRLEICKKFALGAPYDIERKALANIIESIPIESLSIIKKLEILIDCTNLSIDTAFVERLLNSLPLKPETIEEIKRSERITKEQMQEIENAISIETLTLEEKINIFSMISYQYKNVIEFNQEFIEKLIKSLPIKESSIEETLRTIKLLYLVPSAQIIDELIESESLSPEQKYQILVLSSNYEILRWEQQIEIIKTLPIREKIKIIDTISLFDDQRKDILRTIKKEEIETNFAYLASSTTNLEDLIEILTNMNLFEDNIFLEKVKDEFIDVISKNYFIDKSRLNQFYQMFGIDSIRFITNENIRGILQLPNEYYNKIIELYNSSTLNNTIINTVYNALIQREFGIENKNILEFYDNIKMHLARKDINKVKEMVKTISENLNIEHLLETELFAKYIKDKNYTKEYCYQNIESILMEICISQMQEYKELNLDLIQAFCNNHITVKRERYLKKRQEQFYTDLKFPTIPQKEKLVPKVIKDLSVEELINLITSIDLNLLSEEQKELITNKNILLECIKFKKNPQEYQENKLIVDKKDLTSKYLKIFNQITEIMFNNKMLDKYATPNESIQYIPKQFGTRGLEILAGTDYNKLSRYLLFTDKFEELKKVMETYGFLGWQDIFQNLIDSSKLEADVDIITTLLEYFPIISEKVDKSKKSGMMDEYLKKASVYSPFSQLCKMLFEEENLLLLKNNPIPNSAKSIVGKDRIIKAQEYIPQIFKRENITVPPIQELFTNNKGNKTLKVVIGDTTNMINFTYGERTEACMRIGGIAHSLFEFALLNENGFHIRFEDPETGQFVSRATCFRKGNTLFINQLRNSYSTEYLDEDLCEICGKLANRLIELTSSSKYPIENVIISDGYAMKFSKRECTKLNITSMDIKKGCNVYTDIQPETAIVLATTAKDTPYAEFDLDPEKAEKYPVLRTLPIMHNDMIEAAKRINQLMLINQTLTGESLGLTTPLNQDNIKIAITGEDWFVYVNVKNEIESKILDNLPESKKQKATEEVKKALDMINKLLVSEQNIQIEQSEIGGTYARR